MLGMTRALLTTTSYSPYFYNDVLRLHFNAFLDHMEWCSECIKQKFIEAGYDVSKWKSPVQSNHGVVQGL